MSTVAIKFLFLKIPHLLKTKEFAESTTKLILKQAMFAKSKRNAYEIWHDILPGKLNSI